MNHYFNFDSAQGVSGTTQSMFKQGVKFAFFKADEKRPLSFRILPAYSWHEGTVTNPMDYVPAVSIVGGKPMINQWITKVFVSRSFIKGAKTIVSRRTLVEYNEDGTAVPQEDPLSQVIDFCAHNENEWGYLIKDQGQYPFNRPTDSRAKLPEIRPNFVMNVITYDDDKPGVKLAVIPNTLAILDLVRTKVGEEGYALRQVTYDVPEAELAKNPSAIFQYGDITDPNGAPIFKFGKGPSQDGGRMVNRITVGIETDPASGRQRVEKACVTPDDMQARQDLAHHATYVNIPTPEEQVKQIVAIMNSRNKDGYHELDMLRMAIGDYASLIPAVPSAPGAAKSVNGFSPAQIQQPKVAQAPQPEPAQPTQTQFRPTAASSARPVKAQPPASRPAFIPTSAPAQPEPAQPMSKTQVTEIPGEAEFDENDWVSQYTSGNGGN